MFDITYSSLTHKLTTAENTILFVGGRDPDYNGVRTVPELECPFNPDGVEPGTYYLKLYITGIPTDGTPNFSLYVSPDPMFSAIVYSPGNPAEYKNGSDFAYYDYVGNILVIIAELVVNESHGLTILVEDEDIVVNQELQYTHNYLNPEGELPPTWYACAEIAGSTSQKLLVFQPDCTHEEVDENEEWTGNYVHTPDKWVKRLNASYFREIELIGEEDPDAYCRQGALCYRKTLLSGRECIPPPFWSITGLNEIVGSFYISFYGYLDLDIDPNSYPNVKTNFQSAGSLVGVSSITLNSLFSLDPWVGGSFPSNGRISAIICDGTSTSQQYAVITSRYVRDPDNPPPYATYDAETDLWTISVPIPNGIHIVLFFPVYVDEYVETPRYAYDTYAIYSRSNGIYGKYELSDPISPSRTFRVKNSSVSEFTDPYYYNRCYLYIAPPGILLSDLRDDNSKYNFNISASCGGGASAYAPVSIPIEVFELGNLYTIPGQDPYKSWSSPGYWWAEYVALLEDIVSSQLSEYSHNSSFFSSVINNSSSIKQLVISDHPQYSGSNYFSSINVPGNISTTSDAMYVRLGYYANDPWTLVGFVYTYPTVNNDASIPDFGIESLDDLTPIGLPNGAAGAQFNILESNNPYFSQSFANSPTPGNGNSVSVGPLLYDEVYDAYYNIVTSFALTQVSLSNLVFGNNQISPFLQATVRLRVETYKYMNGVYYNAPTSILSKNGIPIVVEGECTYTTNLIGPPMKNRESIATVEDNHTGYGLWNGNYSICSHVPQENSPIQEYLPGYLTPGPQSYDRESLTTWVGWCPYQFTSLDPYLDENHDFIGPGALFTQPFNKFSGPFAVYPASQSIIYDCVVSGSVSLVNLS